MSDAKNIFQAALSPATYLTGAGIRGAKKLTEAPGLPPARPFPDPNDPSRKRAAQRAAQRKYAGAGRAGTVLTAGDKLG